MPPRTLSPAALQQRKNAVTEMIQVAAALDLCRSGSGLAGATPRQIGQLNRALAVLRCPALNEPGAHAAIQVIASLLASPEPRAALVQLFTSSLCVLAPPGSAGRCKQSRQQTQPDVTQQQQPH